MKEPSPKGHRFRKVLGWMTVPGIVLGFFLAYRWAGIPSQFSSTYLGGSPNAGMVLENTRFTDYSQGHKTWAFVADRMELERLPGSALAHIQRATITNLRSGTLYAPPKPSSTLPPTSSTQLQEKTTSTGPVTATFHAKQGRYTVGSLDPLPADLTLLYAVQWQLKLTGEVDFRTRSDEHLQADSITILEMTNRQNRKLERRVLCDSGVQVTRKDVTVHANQARYNPGDQTVECWGGVRLTYSGNSVQAERVFWSFRDQTLRCPEKATGVAQDLPFTAEGLTIDLKNHLLRANSGSVELRREEGEQGLSSIAELGAKTMRTPLKNTSRQARGLATVALAGVLGAGQASQTETSQKPPEKLPATGKTSAPKKDKQKTAHIRFDGPWKLDQSNNMMTGSNFRYQEEDTVITGLSARYDKTKKYLWAEGDLVMDSPENHATAEKAEVDDGDAKLAVITGNVVMVMKPKEKTEGRPPTPNPGGAGKPETEVPPKLGDRGQKTEEKTDDSGEVRKRGVTITCDRVEQYRKKKFSILKGHLVFKQTFTNKEGKKIERTLTAEHAEYDGKTEKAVLFAPVDGHDNEGQEFHSEANLLIGTKEGEETIESKGKGTIKIYRDEETDSTEPTPNTPPPTPPRKPIDK